MTMIEFDDKAYQKALPIIQETYDINSVEEFKQMSVQYMPNDVLIALEREQAKINESKNIYPVSATTESNDGKTCKYCTSELIIKIRQIKIRGEWTESKVLACPNGGVECKSKKQKSNFRELIEKGRELVNKADGIYEIETRNLEVSELKLWIEENPTNNHQVTAPNTDVTKLIFGTKTIYETQTEKKDKLVEDVICQHLLEEIYNEETDNYKTNELYEVVKVESIGNFPLHMSTCYQCENIRSNYDNYLYDVDLTPESIQAKKKLIESFDGLTYYRVTYRRKEQNIQKLILRELENRRFGLLNEDFVVSQQVSDRIYLRYANLGGYCIPDNIKAKITAQLKIMEKNGLIEGQKKQHVFAEHRQEKFNYFKDKKYLNHDYVGGATTLKTYRIVDRYSPYLTKQFMNAWNDVKEHLKEKRYNDEETNLYWIMVRRELIQLVTKTVGTEWLFKIDTGRIILCSLNPKIKGRRKW